MLERLGHELARDLNSENIQAGLRRAFHLALGVLVGPGVPLGLLYALTRPVPLSPAFAAGLLGLALLLSGAAFYLPRLFADPTMLPRQQAITTALQLVSAPAVPLLLACAFLYMPLLALALGLLGAACYGLARRKIDALALDWTHETSP